MIGGETKNQLNRSFIRQINRILTRREKFTWELTIQLTGQRNNASFRYFSVYWAPVGRAGTVAAAVDLRALCWILMSRALSRRSSFPEQSVNVQIVVKKIRKFYVKTRQKQLSIENTPRSPFFHLKSNIPKLLKCCCNILFISDSLSSKTSSWVEISY